MLFNSIEFLFVFLPITYLVFWALSSARARYVWLAVTGYVFYSSWNPWFTLLMLFSTLVSYTAGLGMLRWDDPQRRKLCLIIPVTADLGSSDSSSMPTSASPRHETPLICSVAISPAAS